MLITWILWTIIIFFLGHKFGYIYAHSVIAKECEKLGGFWVGKKVYECVKVHKQEDQIPLKSPLKS